MDQKFFRIPFASAGDKQQIPDDKNAEGYVSFVEGWGEDYQKDLMSDANAKEVERDVMNGILNAITVALRQYQTDSFPEWITPANNGGTAYPYGVGVVVRHRQGNGAFISYVSLTDNNTTEPGTEGARWQGFIYRRASQDEADAGTDDTLIITPPTLQQAIKNAIGNITTELAPFLLPVGIIAAWGSTVPPDGWIEANGQAFDIAKNPKLHAVYPSGNVPDLRGRFVRGWAHGSGEDPEPGRGILSLQLPADMNHYHLIGRANADSGERGDDFTMPVRGQNWHGQSYGAREFWCPDQFPHFSQIPNGQVGQSLASGNPVKYDDSAGMNAPHPVNVALMYIVKTDQADNIKPDPTPTNIIVTPSSLNIGVGKTQQFTAQVLPADLAPNFPVTWISTNTAVGAINGNGLFTAVGPGTTDIIASVSSGLSVRLTVRVDILLTSIALAAIPDQVAGNTYELVVTKTPSNATETLSYASTDSAVASLTTDGRLMAAGEGTATVSVTGSVSGVSANRVVKVTAAPVVSDYLAIKNNLSEIADAGKKAQEASQKNLGLGKLATKDAITAKEAGAVPVSDKTLPAGTDLNTITEPGEYFQNVTSNATLALNYPEAVAGALKVYRTGVDVGACRQVYMPYNSTVEHRRYAFGDPLVFSAWKAY
ncbi:Bacterial Ig-like domain (group 2) [Serratia marcescens]|uniref:Ig-like domain-containing protein n=1 Tax=Serratia marcescens TaxID=615 RepID=UPI00217B0B3A|nr:Ig-like domain-containing protein [Serratia marcescens]CAI0869544.1 Bacterial Ig-like domain (group 2) [Serratia marcescens]CAI0977768.1 Bacterial Ig-like domain (group 2) [Serratia marcescens]